MRYASLRWLGLLCFATIASGCASKSYVVLLESPDGTTGAIVVQTSQGVTRIDKKHQGIALDSRSSQTFTVAQTRLDKDFSAAMSAQPILPKSYLLYFELGDTKLTADSEAKIPEVIQTIRDRGPSAVSVIGHTDTASGDAWNERLGLMRAQTIAKLLKANGLQAIELIVTSHGESNLLVKTPNETREPKNRRVEVTIR
jgi:outer membrane protein OmpA-like peptidoglycan-associated protein